MTTTAATRDSPPQALTGRLHHECAGTRRINTQLCSAAELAAWLGHETPVAAVVDLAGYRTRRAVK